MSINSLSVIKQYPQLTQFESVKSNILDLASNCSNIIVNDSSLDSSKSLLKKAKRVETIIEDIRKKITSPILEQKRIIDEYAKGLVKELNESVKDLRSRVLSFEVEKEEQRKIEVQKLADALNLKVLELQAEESKLSELIKSDLDSLSDADFQKVSSLKDELLNYNQIDDSLDAAKSKNLSRVLDYTVTDISLVPHEYLMIDDKAVKAALKSGVRSISGINIFYNHHLVIR